MVNQQNLLQVYKQLIKAIVKNDRRSKIIQRANEISKEISLLSYQKINLLRQPSNEDTKAKLSKLRSVQEIDSKINKLKAEDPKCDKNMLYISNSMKTDIREDMKAILIKENDRQINRKLNNFIDIAAFLNNQREYDELIERYNLGSRGLTQDEVVKRTANKVGLDVPL
ncbi:hypothetical protein Kpol_1003p30 [Vanderwaltozyma polyspora DSM 70294]|uniref:Uncharacterized protein n=1 Tax=Vanderwaltozyma polyspora (strain ATCC 22028 / DSM 70294 / BCRC 21397 / CBS 2163 / NBRC 10782 / NRRL Y-8283 / UCD 57-17) TaxID=436907 RepID=A7TLY8_VANPO|nr:uncharacterized protein Kpol_1003p30 [Vanderwaltozyma polyspora DSM 70294]EDO16725.1 hypothetical protein Kpol_1003p30 [Vanderwaltozyma polyspora DSM 70294]